MSPNTINAITWDGFIIKIDISSPDGRRVIEINADEVLNIGKELLFTPSEPTIEPPMEGGV